MRFMLLAAASVAAIGALGATSASAASPGGYLDGGYSDTTCSGCSGNLNDWNITGAVNMPFGASHFSGQLDGDYHGFSGGGSSFHSDQAAISVMWTGAMGRIGATAGTNEFGGSGSSFDFQNYGAFGVWYPNQQWTVGIKGASVTCSGCSSATAWGGRVMGYATPNIALNLDYDTFQSNGGGHLDTWSAAGEWQPTANPWTVRLGYANTSISGGGPTLNTYSINFRWYFGGGSTLVGHHREGAEPWGTQQSAFRFLF